MLSRRGFFAIVFGLALCLAVAQAAWGGFGVWWSLTRYYQVDIGHIVAAAGGALVVAGLVLMGRGALRGGLVALLGAVLGLPLWYSPVNAFLSLILVAALVSLILGYKKRRRQLHV